MIPHLPPSEPGMWDPRKKTKQLIEETIVQKGTLLLKNEKDADYLNINYNRVCHNRITVYDKERKKTQAKHFIKSFLLCIKHIYSIYSFTIFVNASSV